MPARTLALLWLLPAAALAQAPVSGRVTLKGVPFAKEIVVPRGAKACEPAPRDETWKVGADGALGQVVVWVKGAKGATTPAEARVSLRGCVQRPRVQAATVGSTLVVVNEDKAHHHLQGKVDGKPVFTVAMPLAGQTFTWRLDRAMWLELSCDAHPFERAVVAVFDHPHFAITGDDGAYQLPGVPAGAQDVAARHEARDEQTRRVDTAAGPARADFEFTAPPPPPARPDKP